MIEMFTREGRAVQVAEGAKAFTQARKCGRCGGAGRSDRWAFTGYTCFDCGGDGNGGTETVKVYTAEKLAKLNATKAKADAKKAAAASAKAAQLAAEAAARKEAFLAENAALIARARPYMVSAEDREPGFIERVMTKAITESKITENQAAAVLAAIEKIEETARKRAASGYLGKVGERIEAEVTVERAFPFERPRFGAGWSFETVWIITMRDQAGNAIVSKSPAFAPEEGRKLTIRATVKEHAEYKGERQTVVARVQVKEAKEQAA